MDSARVSDLPHVTQHGALGHLPPSSKVNPKLFTGLASGDARHRPLMSSFSDNQLSETTSRFYLYLTYLCVYLFMEMTDAESVIVTHQGIREMEVI